MSTAPSTLQAVSDRDAAGGRSGRLALALLPVLLAIADSRWFHSSTNRDAWLYYGYYENLISYLRLFPDVYYSSRLGATVPGFVLHHLLPTMAANAVLHLGLLAVASLAFYYVASRLFQHSAALFGTITFAANPYLLSAIGWNYVDGFGITYFVLALAAATAGATAKKRSALWIAVSGAFVALLLSTNVSYGLYAPVVAGHFIFVRRLQRPFPWRDLVVSGLVMAAGTVATFLLLGGLSAAAGGRFFYLAPSLGFIAGFVKSPNIFRDPTYSWIPGAAWLVLPAVTLIAAAIALVRSRDSAARSLTATTAHLAWMWIALGALQVWGDTAMLQHAYYASMLIPVTCLVVAALADGRLEGRVTRRLALAMIVMTALPLALSRFADLRGVVVPAAVAATAAVFASVLLFVTIRNGRSPLAAVVCLALFNLACLQRLEHDRTSRAGASEFSQITRAFEAIDDFDPSHNARLWYSMSEPNGRAYDMVASAFLLCPRMVSGDFPELHGGRMCDGRQLTPGTPVVIMSSRHDALDRARKSLGATGLGMSVLRSDTIAGGPIPNFFIHYLRVERR